jgi:hypothetical protein
MTPPVSGFSDVAQVTAPRRLIRMSVEPYAFAAIL